MAQDAVDQLKQMLGEDQSTFLEFLQEPTLTHLAESVASRLDADAEALQRELDSRIKLLPGWLRGVAERVLGSGGAS